MIEKFGAEHGKELYASCIPVEDLHTHIHRTPNTTPIYNEVFASIYTNARYQAK